jgi:hypothetical protein
LVRALRLSPWANCSDPLQRCREPGRAEVRVVGIGYAPEYFREAQCPATCGAENRFCSRFCDNCGAHRSTELGS